MKTGDTEYHILNLGAGVQSTTLYLMSAEGKVRKFDYAIFADTQEEPEAVYRHLDWLQTVGGPPILIRTKAKLGDDLMLGRKALSSGFASIPAFTTTGAGAAPGRTRRQCSTDYKIAVIERAIRRDVLRLKPGQRIPKGVRVHQYFGISMDEAGRATRIWERFHIEQSTWAEPHFPLIEMAMARPNCILWLEGRVPHTVPRSAYTFCPFHSDAEWQRLRDAGGKDSERIVQIDVALRSPGMAVNQKMDQTMYLHRSCLPIGQVDFKPKVRDKELQLGFGYECEGVCGV
jgi:hypothetical protein